MIILLILWAKQIQAQENNDSVNVVSIEAKLKNDGQKLKLTFQQSTFENYSMKIDKSKCKKFIKPCPSKANSHISDSTKWSIELKESTGIHKTFLIKGPKDSELVIDDVNYDFLSTKKTEMNDDGLSWEVEIKTENDSLETVFDIVPLVPNPKSGCWVFVSCND